MLSIRKKQQSIFFKKLQVKLRLKCLLQLHTQTSIPYILMINFHMTSSEIIFYILRPSPPVERQQKI